jgi:23S rRNA C2498 (ribose-2'-O)-methylase RlmM
MKADDLGAAPGGLPRQLVNPRQVVILVAVSVLELGGGDTYVSHADGPLPVNSRTFRRAK